MLVLSKLTNINHASGGSYDPPFFLYSALFPARRRGLAGLPRTAANFGGASPHGGGFGGASPHGGGFGGASPPGGGLGGLPRTAFSAAAVHSAWGGQFFRCFSHTRPAYGKSIRKNFAGYIAVFHIA